MIIDQPKFGDDPLFVIDKPGMLLFGKEEDC